MLKNHFVTNLKNIFQHIKKTHSEQLTSDIEGG